MKKLLTRKKRGNGDLICSLFVLLAMTVVVLFFIGSIGHVVIRTQIDQVARKYILRMETAGCLTSSDKTALLADLKNIPAVKQLGDSVDIEIVSPTVDKIDKPQGYGNEVTLTIKCPAMVMAYIPAHDTTVDNGDGTQTTTKEHGIMGEFGKKKEYFTVTKQSTAKY